MCIKILIHAAKMRIFSDLKVFNDIETIISKIYFLFFSQDTANAVSFIILPKNNVMYS